MKINFYKNNKGVTIVELLVSLAILLLVLGIGYNFFFFSAKSYNSAEKKWINQREARKAADFIGKSLRNAYNLGVTESDSGAGEDGKKYIFQTNTGSIVFRDGKSSSLVTIAEGNLNLDFKKALNRESNPLDNVLAYEVKANDINYSVDSSVMLANMPKTKSIIMEKKTGTEISNGKAIWFESASDFSSIPDASLSAFCFVATAAYGTNTQPSVMLLRNFRDEYLMTNPIGRAFVGFYYKNSPPVARKIAGSEPLKALVRILLAPVIGLAYAIMKKEILLAIILFLMLKVYYSRRRESTLS